MNETLDKAQLSWWGVVLRGLAIGLADLVPGVSGGTIAFITGIYERLLAAIKLGSSPLVLVLLLRGNLRLFWKTVDGNFLALLLAGIALAILLGVEVIHSLLDNQLVVLLAFFFGLTLGAAFHIMRIHRLHRPEVLLPLFVGLALAWGLQQVDPVQLGSTPNLQAYFAAGILTLCVMILPGVSGSLLLLLLGIYPFLVDAVRERDVAVVLTFAGGGVLGLALFARLLRNLLRRWPAPTLGLLVGVMLGALPRLWPWRASEVGIKPILQPAVSPYAHDEPQIALAAVFLLVGLVLVETLAYLSSSVERKRLKGLDKA